MQKEICKENTECVECKREIKREQNVSLRCSNCGTTAKTNEIALWCMPRLCIKCNNYSMYEEKGK